MQILPASSYPMVPLSASYAYDNFNMDSHLQQWDDGTVTIDTPILNNIKDVVANKNTLMYMTTSETIDDILSDNGVTIDETIGNGTIGIIADNGNYLSVAGTSLYPSATAFGDTETFGLIANDDGTVSFLYETSYIGVEPSAPWNLIITTDSSIIDKEYHKFNIIQNGNKFLIQTMPIGTGVDGQTPPLFERYIKPVAGTGIMRATGTTVIDENLFTISTITPGGGVIPGATYGGLESNTWWIKYFNTVNNQNGTNQTVDIDFNESLSGVKLNYLVTNAYKTKIDKNSYNDNLTVGNMEVDISNLKTIESPSYEYSEKTGVSGADSVTLRDYSKIFTGTNQEYGYEHPFFGFISDTKEVVFETDKLTYFHFPNTAQVTPLSSSGIIEGGAVACSSPFRSDKIWKKNANYKKNIWWGDSLQWQQGTWLCSWLSGSINSDTKPVWKDRWYNAGYVTYQQAISSYEEVFVSNDPVVVDVDSSMTLDPRVWYKYHHIGNNYNQTIVDTLTGNGTALKLHYDDWASTVIDKSPYGNDGILRGSATTGTSKIGEKINDVLVLNGDKQYCYVPYNSSYDVTDAITHSVWVNTDDWSNVEGNHILSNNFRGGWSLEWTNGFVNYIYPTYESTYGHIMFTNIDDTIYSDKLLPTSGAVFGNPTAIAVDKDLFTWVLDNSPNKSLFKLDYNGDILEQKQFDSNENLRDMVLDGNENIWVLGNSVSSFKTTLESTSGVSLDPTIYYPFNGSVVDESHNQVTVDVVTGVEMTTDRFGNENKAIYLSGGDYSYVQQTLTPVQAYYNTALFNVSGVSYSYWFTVDDTSVVPSNSILSFMSSNDSIGTDPDDTHWRGSVVIDNATNQLYSRHDTYTGMTSPGQPITQLRSLSSQPIQEDTWYHVAEVWDRVAGEAKLYINGELHDQDSLLKANNLSGWLSGSYFKDDFDVTITQSNSGNLSGAFQTGHSVDPGSIQMTLCATGPYGLSSISIFDNGLGQLTSTAGITGTVPSYTWPSYVEWFLDSNTYPPLSAGVVTIDNYTGTATQGYFNNDNVFWLGRRKGYRTGHKGKLDDFMVFKHPLTETEVQALYTNTYNICAVPNATKIDTDNDSVVRVFATDDVCINNNSLAWTVSGGSIFNESTLILSGIDATNINCDKDNNIWVLNDVNKFMKLDSTGSFILSGEVTDTTDSGTRSVNFLNLYDGTEYQDYAMIIQGSDRTVYKFDMDGEYISKVDLSDGINLDEYANHDKELMEFDGNGDFTGYDWSRKFSYVNCSQAPQVVSKLTTRNGDLLTETSLSVPASALSKGWHHFVTTYEGTSGNAKLYIDTVLTDTKTTLSASEIYYKYENAFTIGVKSGIFRDLSNELGVDDYYLKGSVDDVRIYDWAINSSDINNIYMTRFDFSDLLWNMPTGDQNYLEEVERFFKNKLPGLKSQYFNIRLVNLGITDLALRTEIENIIKNTISKVAPAHSELYKIIWD